MKITPIQYARSLYEATKDKSQNETNVVLGNFVKILNKNNHFKLKNEIIEKFRQIYNQESGIIEAEVTSREMLSNELRNKLRNYVNNKYNVKEVVLVEKVDRNIRGGVIIKTGDEVIDGSIKSRLKELRKELISSELKN